VFGKKHTVADQLVEVLVQAGVQRIHGNAAGTVAIFGGIGCAWQGQISATSRPESFG
jgi:hypothetical protein